MLMFATQDTERLLLPVHNSDFQLLAPKAAQSLRNTLHLMSVDGVIYRTILATGSDTQVVHQLRSKLEKVHPAIRELVEAGSYKFVLLTETDAKRQSLARRLDAGKTFSTSSS